MPTTDAAVAAGKDPDADVSMGLFCYPILMAADILMFNANEVPVGHDQIQHLEMARDVATRFNNLYAKPDESFFVLPQATGGSAIEVLPGLDGRKMSKSYNNVIPLFEGGRKALDEAISRIVTDSRLPGEPKDPDSTSPSFTTPSPPKKNPPPSVRNSVTVLAGVRPRSASPTRSTPKSARCANATKI